MQNSLKLDDARRIILRSVMDRLIPAVDDLPGAGEMGLAAEVERMAGSVPRYGAALSGVLNAFAQDLSAKAAGGFRGLDGEAQDNAIRVIENSLPARFGEFLEIVYLAYYSDAAVHRRIGWSGRPPQPEGFNLPPFDDSIMENVRKREPFWREAPG